jgi:ADP-ribose pyrophosphatase
MTKPRKASGHPPAPSASPMPDTETLYQGRFLILHRERRWEYVSRNRSSGAAVFVVAVTDAEEIVLVEQYRVPLHARCIELPAGIMGDEEAHHDETPEASALRELEEETGFRGSRTRVLASGPTAPGMSSELIHLVLATGLKRVHAGGGVDGEDITPHVVPLDQVHDWLAARAAEGLRVEPRIYAGLYFARRQSFPIQR